MVGGRLLTTGTIEEKMFQRQILKQSLSGAVVDARDNARAHFTREELRVKQKKNAVEDLSVLFFSFRYWPS